MLEYVMLGLILNKEMTGYDLKQCMENGVGLFFKASYGSLYPLLRKLTERRCLLVREESGGGRTKKYYQITEEGKKEFYQWLRNPVSGGQERGSSLAKVYFFDLLSEEEREPLFQAYEERERKHLEELTRLCDQFDAENPSYYYKLSTLYYGISKIQENLRWCRAIRERHLLNKI